MTGAARAVCHMVGAVYPGRVEAAAGAGYNTGKEGKTMILTENLCKSFPAPRLEQRELGSDASGGYYRSRSPREIRALDGVSFHVAAGETVGLIGTNGAGKTTLLKLLCGMLQPSGGMARVFGKDPGRFGRPERKRLGVCFGHGPFPSQEQSASECLETARAVYGIAPDRYRENLAGLDRALRLSPFLGEPVHLLSPGQRMRLNLACALIHDPEVLLLDEPAVGLDAVAKEELCRLIGRYREERKAAVLLSSHDMTEIGRLCPRVLVMDKGSLVYDGTMRQLRERYGAVHHMEIETDGALPDISDLPVLRYAIQNHTLSLTFDSRRLSRGMVAEHLLTYAGIRNIRVVEPGIEEIILEIHNGRRKTDGPDRQQTADRSQRPDQGI